MGDYFRDLWPRAAVVAMMSATITTQLKPAAAPQESMAVPARAAAAAMPAVLAEFIQVKAWVKIRGSIFRSVRA